MDETDSKQPEIHRKIHTSLWILKISRKNSADQKSRDFCQIFVISNKKIHRLEYGLKNLYEIYRLAYGFLFFVIPIFGYTFLKP